MFLADTENALWGDMHAARHLTIFALTVHTAMASQRSSLVSNSLQR
jgi:hypothetical protein|eukprot:COSAG01_NODE_12161_length_1790_cov_2.607333_2_plen_46_part_00